MKTILKLTVAVSVLTLMVPEAHAIFGTWRRAARTAVVVEGMSAGKSQQQAASATAQQQSATAAQQSATAAQQSATAAQQSAASTHPAAPAPAAPPAAASGEKLAIGTVVASLPPGSVATPVGGVEYYYSGGNFYRAVFQGNTLVYVTAEPK